MISKSFLFVLALLLILTLTAFFGSGPWSWAVGIAYIGYDTALLLFVTVKILQILKVKNGEQALSPRRPRVAVLITARNEATVLHECLQALHDQSDLPDEIHWIDDGSTDDTQALIQNIFFDISFENIKPLLQTHFKRHSGKADSLNQIWPIAQADVLVTLDADTILEQNAILEIRNAFSKNSNLAATGGLLTPQSVMAPGSLFEMFQKFEYIRSFLARRAWMSKNALLLVSGAFAAYRKDVLHNVGGYDAKSLVEDYDLTHRIHRYSYEHGLHYEVNVTVKAMATTDVPVRLKQFLKQRQRWFAGFLQTQFKNGDMVGNPKYGTIGRFMLVIKSADTLQPIYGLVTLFSIFYLWYTHRMIYPFIWKALLTKIIIDLVFHYGSVALYFRWSKKPLHARVWLLSTLSTFLEPVFFQILRHTGATLGWVAFLRGGNLDWTPQRN